MCMAADYIAPGERLRPQPHLCSGGGYPRTPGTGPASYPPTPGSPAAAVQRLRGAEFAHSQAPAPRASIWGGGLHAENSQRYWCLQALNFMPIP